MSAKLIQTQVQKQIFAPTMQQSIEVLLLPYIELAQAIEQELQGNPLLEIDEKEQAQRELESEERLDQEISQRMDRAAHASNVPIYDDVQDDETPAMPLKKEVPLEDILLSQLRVELSDPVLIAIGEMIIGNLNEEGYLRITLEEISGSLGLDTIDRAETVLKIIQSFEPVGIAARDLSECLLLQAQEYVKDENSPVWEIITNHLPELGKKHYALISKKTGLPLQAVKDCARLISSFDPKPARNFRPLDPSIFIKPDVIVKYHQSTGMTISLNHDTIPVLRINPFYRNMLKDKNLSKEERTFIREKMRNALSFIKSIEQRGSTIEAITRYILEKQKDFFAAGSSGLVPMTLKDIAETINRNESTVSRAINNKYIETPQGLYPLKFFFTQGVCDTPLDGKNKVSNQSIKEALQDLIEDENPARPLSDQEIQTHFENKGLKLARRTIAKYRQGLKILPSHLRKK